MFMKQCVPGMRTVLRLLVSVILLLYCHGGRGGSGTVGSGTAGSIPDGVIAIFH